MRLIFVSLLISGAVCGQFSDLATTGDGSQLYFSSPLRLKGTDQFATPKIFRYNFGVFELYRQVQREVLQFDSRKTNHYRLAAPSVSEDGQAVAFSAGAECNAGSGCIGFIFSTGEVDSYGAPAPIVSYNGGLKVSGNRRYALNIQDPYSPLVSLIDLLDGSSVLLRMPGMRAFTVIGNGKQALADDGTVLLQDMQGPLLWKSGQVRRIPLANTPNDARLSRFGNMVVYETGIAGSDYQLIAHDIATGREALLAHGPLLPMTRNPTIPFLSEPSLSNDGRIVTYLAPVADGTLQLFRQNTDGSGRLQLTQEPGGIGASVLSGRANVAYAGTNTGRLLKISLPAGTIQDVTGPTPSIAGVEGAAAPGGIMTISGQSLTDAQGMAAVRVNGVSAPLLSWAPDRVTFQIPFEVSVASPLIVTVGSGRSPFEAVYSLPAAMAVPKFIMSRSGLSDIADLAIAAHTDFSSLVTAENPAVPGEALHFYLTGLGPVMPPVPAGSVTPGDTLYAAVLPLTCKMSDRNANPDAPVLYAGLAPGFIGVYQVDVRVPYGLSSTRPGISCVAQLPIGTTTGSADFYLQP